MKMKKVYIIFAGMIMGVLSSCTTYRIKEVTHKNGVSYYFPQKRSGFGEWMDMSKVGSFTKEWAGSVIMDDKEVNSTKVKYLNVKDK